MEQRNMGDSVAGGKTFSGGRMDDVWNRDACRPGAGEKETYSDDFFSIGFSVGGNSITWLDSCDCR
jgi:hypothetical protein